MPVGRVILKSISDSKKVSNLKSDGARLLYTWLLTHLDVNGCYSGDAQIINGKVFTRLNKSNRTVESYIVDLEENGLVMRYNVNGDTFLNVPDFVQKQPFINPDREAKSNIPLPDFEQLRTNSGQTPDIVHVKVKVKDKVKVKVKEKDNVPFDEIKDSYNEKCPKLPQVQTLSDKRMTAIRVRYLKYGKEKLELLFKKAGESDFLNGKSTLGWKATFDWLLNENNMLKVLEGNYDNKNKPDWRTT